MEAAADALTSNHLFSRFVVRYIATRPQAMQSLEDVMAVVHDMVGVQRNGSFNREMAKVAMRNLPGCGNMGDRDLDAMMREIIAHSSSARRREGALGQRGNYQLII